MSNEAARDELAEVIFDSHRRNTQIDLLADRRLKGSQLAWAGFAADALLAAGCRKPAVLGYVVVGRDGGMVTGASYTNREAAQAYADRWSADAKASRVDWDYRVAEIVEPA